MNILISFSIEYLQITTNHLWELADNIANHEDPGNINQSMMELGALVCTPKVSVLNQIIFQIHFMF